MHTIRLKAPWLCEPAAGHCRFERCFQRPTGLTPQQTVWLVVESLAPHTSASLNGASLSIDPAHPAGRQQWSIASLLQPRNTVEFSVPLAHPLNSEQREVPGGLIGQVSLQIED